MSELQVSKEINSDFTISLLKFLRVVENSTSQINVLTNFCLGQNVCKMQRSCHYFLNNLKTYSLFSTTHLNILVLLTSLYLQKKTYIEVLTFSLNKKH